MHATGYLEQHNLFVWPFIDVSQEKRRIIAPIILFYIFVAFPFTRFHLEIRFEIYIMTKNSYTKDRTFITTAAAEHMFHADWFEQPRKNQSKQKTKPNNNKINDFSAFLPAAMNVIWSISVNCVDGLDYKLRIFRYAKSRHI